MHAVAVERGLVEGRASSEIIPEMGHRSWTISGRGEYEKSVVEPTGLEPVTPLLAKQVRYQLRHGPSGRVITRPVGC